MNSYRNTPLEQLKTIHSENESDESAWSKDVREMTTALAHLRSLISDLQDDIRFILDETMVALETEKQSTPMRSRSQLGELHSTWINEVHAISNFVQSILNQLEK